MLLFVAHVFDRRINIFTQTGYCGYCVLVSPSPVYNHTVLITLVRKKTLTSLDFLRSIRYCRVSSSSMFFVLSSVRDRLLSRFLVRRDSADTPTEVGVFRWFVLITFLNHLAVRDFSFLDYLDLCSRRVKVTHWQELIVFRLHKNKSKDRKILWHRSYVSDDFALL